MDATIDDLTHTTSGQAVSEGMTIGVMDRNRRWPLERVLFALAGTVTLLSALLAATVSNWFLVLTALVGVNQWLYVLVGGCPASVILRRACHLRSAVYPDDSASIARSKVGGIR